jgi:hypothetical protein
MLLTLIRGNGNYRRPESLAGENRKGKVDHTQRMDARFVLGEF